MPKTSYDPHPETTARGLSGFLTRHGLAIARQELARWDLAPKLTRNQDGSVDLTALHDPAGAPAVQYQRSAKGKLSVKTAAPNQPLPRWLTPQPGYSPHSTRLRRPISTQSTRLPEYIPAGETQNARYLMVQPTTVAAILLRQITIRVVAAAAATASDYIPHRAVRNVLTPEYGTHQYPSPASSKIMAAARRAALDAILETAPSPERRDILSQSLEGHVSHQEPTTGHVPRRIRPRNRRRPHITTLCAPEPEHSKLDTLYSFPVRRPQGNDPAAISAQLTFDLFQ